MLTRGSSSVLAHGLVAHRLSSTLPWVTNELVILVDGVHMVCWSPVGHPFCSTLVHGSYMWYWSMAGTRSIGRSWVIHLGNTGPWLTYGF